MKGVVVITGAAGGIGQAIARRAARDGRTVIILDARPAPETVELIVAEQGSAVAYECDVSRADAVDEVFALVREAHGKVDVLINNAGTMGRWPLPITEARDEDWHSIFETNVKSVFLCSRKVLPDMRAQGRGAIVNIASELAMVAAEGCAMYCASKAAVMHFTRALAVDEARYGVRVNCVCPGPVDTRLLNPTANGGPDAQAARRASARSTLVNRLGTPREIAELTWFIASGAVDFMNGSAVLADGGVTAV